MTLPMNALSHTLDPSSPSDTPNPARSLWPHPAPGLLTLDEAMAMLKTMELAEFKDLNHDLNIACLRRLLTLGDESEIEDILEDTLRAIQYSTSFQAYMEWKAGGKRPMFMEREMERIIRKPPLSESQVRDMSGVSRLRHSREEAAYILSISPRTLDYHIAAGRLRVKHEGSKVLVAHSELVRFAKESHPDPVAPAKRAS